MTKLMSTTEQKTLMMMTVLTSLLKSQSLLTTETLVFEKTSKTVRTQLPSGTFDRWKQMTKEVCAKAYAPYKQGTIYPQVIMRCDDNLNRALLKELKGLGEN